MYSTAPADWGIHRVNVKAVSFHVIQLSISTQFRCQNSSILSNSVSLKYAVLMSRQFYSKQFSFA